MASIKEYIGYVDINRPGPFKQITLIHEIVAAYLHERITPALQPTTQQPYQTDRQDILCL